MGKPILALIICLLLSYCGVAQLKEVTFGKITEEEIKLKDCSYDKDAAAIVLFNIGKTFCYDIGRSFSTDFDLHKRIKIFNTKGFDEANIKIVIPTGKNEGELKKLRAQTCNFDDAGNIEISKVEPAVIFKKKLNKKFTEISFSFPNVRPGSIIEYAYTYQSLDVDIEQWWFQENIPTIYSGYELDFPIGLNLDAIKGGAFSIKENVYTTSARRRFCYTMDSAIAIVREPFMTTVRDYATHVIPVVDNYDPPIGNKVELRYTWADRMIQLMDDEDFGLQLKRNIKSTTDLDDLLKSKSTDFEKMETIYKYVQKNMQWNEVNSIMAMGGVKNAWEDKKGTSGEINFILINLLKEAKLDARPILLSTKNNGAVKPEYTSLRQFNKVMAYVKVGEEVYILDAIEKYTNVNIIPRSVVLTEGIVIDRLKKGGWGWVTLWKEKTRFDASVYTSGVIENDSLKAGLILTSNGYAKIEKVEAYKASKRSYEEEYYQPKQGAIVKSTEIENLDATTEPLIDKVNIEMKMNGTGDYRYFTLNTLSGFSKNIFSNPNRVSDVFYGFKQKYILSGAIIVSDQYALEELPKNKKIISPDSSMEITRIVEKVENLIQYSITFKLNKPYYTAEAYEVFFQIQKLFYAMLEEQIVLKKIKK